MPMLDPALTPVIVSGVFGLAGTVIGALIGKELMKRKRLQEKLELAQSDIAFLLGVEAIHCEMHRDISNATQKIQVRKQATAKGLRWSGKFTPGRVKTDSGYRPPSEKRFWFFKKRIEGESHA